MNTKPKPKLKPNLSRLKPHPLGAMFPPMADDEYGALKKGMKKNGFDPQHPIILFEGAILEGNHRYTAAKATKTQPVFKEFEKTGFQGSPIDFVMQENLRRRNLTPSQLAVLGAELVEKMEEADRIEKAAQKAAAAGGKKTAAKKGKKSKGDKVSKVAKALKTSPRNVAKARALKAADPAAAEAVKAGTVSLHSATEGAEAKKSVEQAKDEEFVKATDRIDKICGPGFALVAAKKLLSKHILQLSGLEEGEMKRVKPLIEAGWSLKAALGYKSVTLTMAHPIRALCERADAQGGKFMLMTDDYVIAVERKPADAAA